MRYLVDANVLSEPTRPAPDAKAVEWLRQNEREIAVDPIILGELRFGILLLHRGKKRARLEQWFDAGVTRLRCLPWEAETGLRWAELLAGLRASGRQKADGNSARRQLPARSRSSQPTGRVDTRTPQGV